MLFNDEDDTIRVVEERDGKFLLNDPEYPFETLKRYGQRFIAHFRLKKVNSPFLENLAIIDTPGMLDSITERDRGYDYQEIIGDLAQMADLVLVLFDPHKQPHILHAIGTDEFEFRIDHFSPGQQGFTGGVGVGAGQDFRLIC